MKKYISYLFIGALALTSLVSCQERFESVPSVKTHRVYFSSNEEVTKTGITVEDGIVTPDWRATKAANVHLFEVGSGEGFSYGTDVEINLSSDNKIAHFMADFPVEMEIIVNPGGEGDGAKGGAKGTSTGPYTYSAVIAQKLADSYTFKVPSTQNPDAGTLIDPDADFLIGYSRDSYDDPHNYDETVVDLYFDRPVALSRLAISNFAVEGELVKSVVINTENSIAGFVSYTDIDFKNAKVNFTPEEGPGIMTLNYDNVAAPSGEPFYAYFVSLPGTAKITSMVVKTNKSVYTREIAGGKDFEFKAESFKNINLDLSKAVREESVIDKNKWYKASVLEDGIDYLIVSAGQALKNNSGEMGHVAVTDNDGVITFTEADPTLTWTATAHVETTGDNGQGGVVAGHFTLTNDGQYLLRDSQEMTLGSSIPSAKPKYAVWDYDGSYLKHESSETMTFYFYYDGEWATSYTQNGAAPGSSVKTVQIYTNRIPQELAFTPAASAEYDLATSEWIVAVPTLSGAQTSVTYALAEDSNPSVATVDADGTVHPLSKGAVTIVATAAGDDQYQAASASYTLRVVDSSVTANTYIKVTSTSDLSIGDKYLLVFEGLAGDTDGDGNPKVFKPILDGNTFSKATSNALDVEIESGTIISSEFEGSHLTLESGYYLKADAVNRYLYPTGSSSGGGTLSAEATATNKLTIAFNDGIAQIKVNSGSNYLVWSTSSHYFSSNAQVSGNYSTGICLYKLDDGRLPQTLSFTPSANAEYDLGTKTWTVDVPTLNGVQTSVTYALSDDSDTTVATVDADGTVHPLSKGSVTVVATAAANEQYRAGSASYTLVITDSSVSIPKWYKADEIEDGGTYIIVSNGYVLLNNNGSAATEEVTVSGGVIEYDAPATAIMTATASSGKFTFKNNGQYMQRGGSSGSYVPSFSSSQSSYYQWTYDSAGSFITATGNSTYYVYYSTGNSKWSMNTSGGDSHKADLYTSNPGRQAQTLEFSGTSFNFDIASGGSFSAPTLSGNQTPVNYSSSKTAVATVDASTGAVTIVGTGMVTITASTDGNDQYKPASASYTIHVTDSSAPVTTKRYVLASSIEAGKSYIIVSGGYALKNNGGSVASVAVTPAGDVIEFESEDEIADLEWAAQTETGFTSNGHFVLSNNGYRINRKSSSGSFSLTFVATSTAMDKYGVWDLQTDGGNTYLFHDSSDTMRCWLYYDGGWKISYRSNNTAPSATEKPTQLYVENP
ncbi:MAG: hypothetical protein IJL91_09800 [Bacteroidales bacterium]|nr:hypothetical protein [Bacteroidales bacterium]